MANDATRHEHHSAAEHPGDDQEGHIAPGGKLTHADHHQSSADAHGGHGDHVARFRRLFWAMLVIGLPVVAFSDMFAMILSYDLPQTPLVGWISPVLGTVMYVWGGRPFLTGAVSEIRAKSPGMMLLVALAITVAFVASAGSSLGFLSYELDFW